MVAAPFGQTKLEKVIDQLRQDFYGGFADGTKMILIDPELETRCMKDVLALRERIVAAFIETNAACIVFKARL